MDETWILQRFLARDEEGLAAAYAQLGPGLTALAARIAGPETAEECVNDALLAAWQAIPPLAPVHLAAYLAKLTRNAALNRYRAQNAQKRGGSVVAVILAGVAFAAACYMELGKLPFDQAEAEQELQEGPLAELSGPSLAMMKLAMGMKQVVVVAWFTSIFIPWGEPATIGVTALVGAVVFLVKCLVDFVVCGVLENSVSRSRFKVLGNQTWAVVGIAVLAFVFVVVGV